MKKSSNIINLTNFSNSEDKDLLLLDEIVNESDTSSLIELDNNNIE